MLEIAVDSLESAVNALNGGADELQICSFLSVGGLTPSFGLVREIMDMIGYHRPKNCRTKINITIRCRGDGEPYNEYDVDSMLDDIKRFKKMDVDSFVFGAIASHLEVDENLSLQVLNVASPKRVTFSRVVDQTRDIIKSAAIIKALGFSGVHTMGLSTSLDDPVAIKRISFLAKKYAAKELSIVPCGVNKDNVACFIDMNCPRVHALCRKVKEPGDQRDFYMGIALDTYVVDEDEVRELRKSIDQAVMARYKNDGHHEDDGHF